MPHVLESESWQVLEKQIDLYGLDKRETIAKNCLKGKKGKGGNKHVKKTEKDEWYDESEWYDEWYECDGGEEKTWDGNHVNSVDDQEVNNAKKGNGKGKKGKNQRKKRRK